MAPSLIALAALGAMLAAPAFAAPKPVVDCPMADAPFSVDSPLIDILLNPAAKAVIESASGRDFSKGSARFVGTTPPTFSAILTLRSSSIFTGLKPEAMPAIDAQLRRLPVTAADRQARCARYDNEIPLLTMDKGKPRVLLFEKITGFKDEPSVNAAHAALVAMAQRKGWSIAATDKGGAINAKTLNGVDVIIWNNISGDVLTLAQRKALQRFLAKGGGFVAVHGSAGDPAYFWDWYVDTLIGARFLAHPMNPQFQDARVSVNKSHPLASALPKEWTMKDEWYSFKTNPRDAGAKVVLTLDEGTYSPVGPMGIDLKMGDHPLAWSNCVGTKGRERGRAFYSAIGHLPETYSQPQYVTLLEAAITWAATDHKACPGKP